MTELDRDTQVDLYRRMLLIRLFEQEVEKFNRLGTIPGFLHTSSGQEAAAVGVCSVLEEDDYITTSHRGHGHLLAKGADLGAMMAELFGRETGLCKGRGGSMHVADFSHGALGATAIVGASIPYAVGAALSAKLRGSDQVAVAFFGEGASNNGAFHEGLNLAAVLKVPVVFVCENNLYSHEAPASYVLPIEHVADRASSYGMPGEIVDGNDLLAVMEVARSSVERARSESSPTLIEAQTYRWNGHHSGDNGRHYRPPEEIASWMERDPIAAFGRHLVDSGVVSDQDLERFLEEAEEEIAAALKYAEDSDFPAPATSTHFLFAEEGVSV